MEGGVHDLDLGADVLSVRPAQGVGIVDALSGEYRCQTAAGLCCGVRQLPDAVRLHGGLEQQHVTLARLLLGDGGKDGFLQLGTAELGGGQLMFQPLHGGRSVHRLYAETLADGLGLLPGAGEVVQGPLAAQQLDPDAFPKFLHR